MTSKSILKNIKSPARVLIKPPSKSILKRPESLLLSPNPIPFAPTFSVIVSSAKVSPHVHFPPSPAMASTFVAYSPNTYNRKPIAVSPTSLGVSIWGGHIYSPSADTFKLSDPPKRTTDVNMKKSRERNLNIPLFEDPRSPKPYSRAGIRFEELSLKVPRGTRAQEELGTALISYPRSPYPSAPVTPTENKVDDLEDVETRGRTMSGWPNRGSKSNKRSVLPTRTRSLEIKTKRQKNNSLQVPSSVAQQFLSPVQESARITITKPVPLNLDSVSVSPESTRLSQAFWQSVSLEDEGDAPDTAYLTASESLTSPAPRLTFGNRDGSLWSPGPSKKEPARLALEASIFSPAQKMAFSKSMIASPSPNDPFAAFPSFTIALMSGSRGTITYPPRALVEQE